MSRQPEGENILGAVESIIGEARDLNRLYPTTLKFRTAELFRGEVAKFMGGRRAWRNAANAVERGEEIGGILGFMDKLAEAETGEGFLKKLNADELVKNDPEYAAEQLFQKLVGAVPLEIETPEEIFEEIKERILTGIDPGADRTVVVDLSQREVDFLKRRVQSSIKTQEEAKGNFGEDKYRDDFEVGETHIRELEEAFKNASNTHNS